MLQKFGGMGGADAMDDIDESDDEGMHAYLHIYGCCSLSLSTLFTAQDTLDYEVCMIFGIRGGN